MSGIVTERHGAVLYVTFNRPEARNALTMEMWEQLTNIAAAVDDDRDVRALVLTGSGGKAFVAGTDIAEFRAFTRPEHAIAYERRVNSALGALEAIGVPVIAAIAGACVGGGAGIASVCDLRVASPSARFGFPVARTLGNCLSIENYARLVALIGVARTKEIVYTARLVDAREGLAIGLYNEVTPDESSLLERATALAEEIAANAPLTIRATKESLRRLAAAARAVDDRDLIELCYSSRDFQEGIEAFFAKRAARWTGV